MKLSKTYKFWLKGKKSVYYCVRKFKGNRAKKYPI